MAKIPPTEPDTGTEAEIEPVAPTKGHRTPTRKEQEAARKRPLVPTDRRLAAKQSRSQVQAARERARIGMAAGEEKYLPVRDKGPQKKYVRDYIDARWSLGEVLLPLLVLVIVSYFFEAIAAYVLIGVWAAIIVVVTEGVIVGILLRRKLAAKFGADRVERVERAVQRWGVLTLAIPAVLPPPMPFKIFVVAAGVVGFSGRKLALTLLIARGMRYAFWAAMGFYYGDEALEWLERFDAWFADRWVAIVIILGGVVLAVLLVLWARGLKARRPGAGEA